MFDLFNQPSYEPQLTEARNRHRGNQEILDENREHFSSQTEIVFSHLRKGEKVSGLQMMGLYKIQDVRPRIAKIRKILEEYGIELMEERIPGGHGAKTWWITPTDLHEVNKRFEKKKSA